MGNKIIENAARLADEVIASARENETAVLAYKKMVLTAVVTASVMQRDIIADINEAKKIDPTKGLTTSLKSLTEKDEMLDSHYDHDILKR